MTDDLAPRLATLPEPVPPSSITATVMARIEREAAAPRAIAAAQAPPRRTHDVSLWIPACLGILLVTGATALSWYGTGIPDLLSPRLLLGGLDAALTGWPATVVALLGFALCLRALFAPLRTR